MCADVFRVLRKRPGRRILYPMGTGVNSALDALKADLREVERALEQYQSLLARRRRLAEAIRAVEAVNSPAPPASTESFAAAVQKLFQAASTAPASPAPNSPVEAAYEVLRREGRPLHISRLIAGIQAQGWYARRDYESLRGTIAAALDKRARARDTYTKPAPATYGLVEWEEAESGDRSDQLTMSG